MTTVQIISSGLIIASSALLAFTLLQIYRLIRRLPEGAHRGLWSILGALVVFFLAGYLVYGIAGEARYEGVSDLLVPVVFFAGSVFAVTICSLSLHMVMDIKEIYSSEAQNVTDPLTGIFNRQFLGRRLGEEILRAKRYGHPLSVFLLDIDNFKSVNDTHGRRVGDAVLKKIAKIVADALRESDVVSRYGGEEIFAILPNTDEAGAALLAERLRHSIEETEMVSSAGTRDGKSVSVTVSVGVAGLGPAEFAVDGLIATADEALYRAKNGGRNRVAIGLGDTES